VKSRSAGEVLVLTSCRVGVPISVRMQEDWGALLRGFGGSEQNPGRGLSARSCGRALQRRCMFQRYLPPPHQCMIVARKGKCMVKPIEHEWTETPKPSGTRGMTVEQGPREMMWMPVLLQELASYGGGWRGPAFLESVLTGNMRRGAPLVTSP